VAQFAKMLNANWRPSERGIDTYQGKEMTKVNNLCEPPKRVGGWTGEKNRMSY